MQSIDNCHESILTCKIVLDTPSLDTVIVTDNIFITDTKSTVDSRTLDGSTIVMLGYWMAVSATQSVRHLTQLSFRSGSFDCIVLKLVSSGSFKARFGGQSEDMR